MTSTRLIRFVVGVIIVSIIMSFGLPRFGIPNSRFMPPALVYKQADDPQSGKATGGTVTRFFHETTNNPFYWGDQLYFVEYAFHAPAPAPPGAKGPDTVYTGDIRVDKDFKASPGQEVRVHYVRTNPDINGIDPEDGGTGFGCRGPRDWFSGWLMYPVIALILGYFMMMILELFAKKEDL